MSALKLAVTTLEGADSVGKVQQMCAKAMRPLPEDPSVGPTPFLPHPIRSKGAFKALPPKAIS